MTLNSVTNAVVVKLQQLWPERTVYCGDAPEEADDCLIVRLLQSQQRTGLGRQRSRQLEFEIQYRSNLSSGDAFLDWMERMYQNFETMSVQTQQQTERGIYLNNVHTKKSDEAGVCSFFFVVGYQFAYLPEPEPQMEQLQQKEVM